jgi:hypothetical protein
MYGIPIVDIPSLSARFARSALPAAPVIELELGWRARSGRAVRRALGSRHGWALSEEGAAGR